MSDLKKIDMTAFIGRDFDCEVKYGLSEWMIRSEVDFEKEPNGANFRPRLKKPQVLDDYGWLPDGFMWRVKFTNMHHYSQVSIFCFAQLRELLVYVTKEDIHWIECLGLEEGYELEGMEVYKGDE